MNRGWSLVFIVALLQSVGGLLQMLANRQQVFEVDTGVAWNTLSERFPTVATQFAMSNQSSISGATAVGLFALAVSYFALREGQRWSWFALWILPAYLAPAMVALAGTENQQAIAILPALLILMAVIGLIIAYPPIFRAQREGTQAVNGP